MSIFKDPDALPQLIGDFKPLDEWQGHLNRVFYGLRGGRVRDYYQTFAAADYHLAHALAADYYERVCTREKVRPSTLKPGTSNLELVVMEWGAGNGNLAACFLNHLQGLDKEKTIYPRIRYILVDREESALALARSNRELARHRERVEFVPGSVEAQAGGQESAVNRFPDGSVDRIFCNELWNELPTKLLLRKDGDIMEEYLRPNLSETMHAAVAADHESWPRFIQAFEACELDTLKGFPDFLEEIVWEREYRKVEGKTMPFRKTVWEFLRQIKEEVLVPVNLGAFDTVKEARRLLHLDAVGFSSFDAGTGDFNVLNDPEKPCYGQYGGQFSFMVNFALVEEVAKHLGVSKVIQESQREFVGRSLGTNVLTLMDLLASHPDAGQFKPWERDRLTLQTIHALNTAYESPYERAIEYPMPNDAPAEQREALENLAATLKPTGVPDTVAYISEEVLMEAMGELEGLGYDRDLTQAALQMPPQGVDYWHFTFE